MGNRFYMFLAMVFCTSNLIAQKVDNAFLVICFEEDYKMSQHKKKEFYWIVSIDSLESKNLDLSKLFMSDFSGENLIECCLGKEIDPYLVFDRTEYGFEDGYLNSLESFKRLVKANREKLQKIKIKWISGQSKTVSVYGSVVRGSFCISNYHVVGQARTGYSGKVVLPHSDFELVDDFWALNGGQLRSRDFFQWNYAIID